MTVDARWARPCSLMGCPGGWRLRKHHHHYNRGHLSVTPCTCDKRGEPGTDLGK